ncbi:MAG: AAA domain-containing protein [Acidimicrobiales bacterium]
MEGHGTVGAEAVASERDLLEAEGGLRPRAIRLFEYLHAVHSSGKPTIRDIADYQDKRWWASAVPDHPSCVVTKTGQEPWLHVSKATVPPPPALPDHLVVEHLEVGITDPAHEPSLRTNSFERLEVDEDEMEQLGQLLEGYLANEWRPWSEVAKVALAARALYQDLYDLRLRLQREEAFVELAWGTGVLSWKLSGERIVHPMVTTRVRIEFDSDTGAVSVHPDSLISNLEIEVLQGLDLNGFDLLVGIRNRFREEPTGPFDPELTNLYDQLLAPLGLDGSVVQADEPSLPTEHPVVTATWGLFVRRRSTLYERFFANIRDALASASIEVPHALASVVADEPSGIEAVGSRANAREWGHVGEQLLMPLPSNPEQEAVAKRLSQHHGVTVQGPPGTGKTHTIANLISHLVGHGKSVLVTSQKDQALRVLRAKIPEEVRDLTVEVLDSSAGSLAQLEVSVQAIYEHAVGLDRPIARQQVSEISDELARTRESVASLRTRIEAVSAREREDYTIGSADHTPSTLGVWLAERADTLSFIPDPIPSAAACPLPPSDLVRLYERAAQLDPDDCVQARLTLPDPSVLPAGGDLASKFDELRSLRDRLADLESILEGR